MKTYVPPTDDEIACCAFAIIAREFPHLAEMKWSEAQAQLTADRQHDAGLLRKRQPSQPRGVHCLTTMTA